MDKIKSFISKYKIILSIIVLVIASFGIYFFASADEDKYRNQVEVSDAKVSVTDGTGVFDSNDDPGNDSSADNQIVRNFDSITYEIKYKLKVKENSSLSDEDKNNKDFTRNVMIDVLLPKSISADVSYDVNSDSNEGANQTNTITSNGIEYNYYQFEINGVSASSDETISHIVISKINSINGTKISPIIRVRESTDESMVSIDNNVDINNLPKLDVKEVTVSAKENYGVKLYPGVIKKGKDKDTAKVPVGVVIYLPNDSNKGIKGIQVPSSVEFDMVVNDPENNSSITSTPSIDNYDSSAYKIDGLPTADDTNNGNAGITADGNTFKLTFDELKFSNNAVSINKVDVNYLSSKMVVFDVERTTPKANITYSISTANDTININFNYDPYVGNYESRVDFVNKNESVSTPGEAVYNVNEEFYIKDTIEYGNGTNPGDDLNGFVNYLKIDDAAIELLEVDDSKDYSIQFAGTDNPTKDNYSVKYGVGKWEPSYFEISSTCSISSKEDLMNYYGGPCVNDNKNIVWYDTIKEAKEKGNIILIQFDYSNIFSPGTSATLIFRGKVKDSNVNVGNTFAVISRGVTLWNGNTHYLSETPNIYYKKTEYDANHNIIANTNDPSGRFGNTLLASAFKVGFDSITIKNSYDSEKSTIYSGLDDPIEINLLPTLSTHENNNVDLVNIKVTLPKELQLFIKKGDKIPIVEAAADGSSILTYTYNEAEISKNNGKIPNLIIHAYVSIETIDNKNVDISANIDAQVSNKNNKYGSVTSIEKRKISTTITLRNTKKINSLGIIDKTYIDRNGEFTYNMKSITKDAATLELLNILPYSGDGIGEGSKFSGTLSVALNGKISEGYKIFYTTDEAKTVLNNEVNSPEASKWIEWKDYNKYRKGITAIKITPTSSINNNSYFGSANGISLKFKTDGNKETNAYYMNFYMLEKNAKICDGDEYPDEDEKCDTNARGTLVYPSNISSVSVYNRTISGKVFEDEDYDGLYNKNEKELSNQIVELYKLNKSGEFDPQNPLDVISDSDQKVSSSDVTTDSDGVYSFKSLASGNYYVKAIFDCDKYVVTDKNKAVIDSAVDTSSIDSDFITVPTENSSTCSAVSNIITLNNDNSVVKNIDLGLRIRQNFDIKISKYITNVTINSNKGTKSIDYDKETKVKIDVKNLKNTSFRVTYNFEIENTKYFPGTIGTIMESIPEGMTFDPSLAENDGWYETSDGTLYYEYLSNKLLMPGEKYHIKIVLDLVTDEGGNFVNVVMVDDLKVMDTTSDFITDVEIVNIPDDILEDDIPDEDLSEDTSDEDPSDDTLDEDPSEEDIEDDGSDY